MPVGEGTTKTTLWHNNKIRLYNAFLKIPQCFSKCAYFLLVFRKDVLTMKFNLETARVTQNKPPTHTLFGLVTQFYLLYTRSECATSRACKLKRIMVFLRNAYESNKCCNEALKCVFNVSLKRDGKQIISPFIFTMPMSAHSFIDSVLFPCLC